MIKKIILLLVFTSTVIYTMEEKELQIFEKPKEVTEKREREYLPPHVRTSERLLRELAQATTPLPPFNTEGGFTTIDEVRKRKETDTLTPKEVHEILELKEQRLSKTITDLELGNIGNIPSSHTEDLAKKPSTDDEPTEDDIIAEALRIAYGRNHNQHHLKKYVSKRITHLEKSPKEEDLKKATDTREFLKDSARKAKSAANTARSEKITTPQKPVRSAAIGIRESINVSELQALTKIEVIKHETIKQLVNEAATEHNSAQKTEKNLIAFGGVALTALATVATALITKYTTHCP